MSRCIYFYFVFYFFISYYLSWDSLSFLNLWLNICNSFLKILSHIFKNISSTPLSISFLSGTPMSYIVLQNFVSLFPLSLSPPIPKDFSSGLLIPSSVGSSQWVHQRNSFSLTPFYSYYFLHFCLTLIVSISLLKHPAFPTRSFNSIIILILNFISNCSSLGPSESGSVDWVLYLLMMG